MDWLGPTVKVSYEQGPNELHITAKKLRRKFDILLGGALILGSAVLLVLSDTGVGFWLLITGTAMLVSTFWPSRPSELRISAGGFSTSGTYYHWGSFDRLLYDSGGENAPRGLHAKQGFSKMCILQGPSAEQTEQILTRIYAFVPNPPFNTKKDGLGVMLHEVTEMFAGNPFKDSSNT